MTRSALSNIAYEALVRARRKFSNREERCIRETWTAEQELVLLRLYPDMPVEVKALEIIGAPGGSTFMQIGREDSK
ncbi:TPA: hypothetical protein ACXI9I_001935 [Pseudomonas aeruginosa]